MSKRSTTGQPKVGTGKPARQSDQPKGVGQRLLKEYSTRHEREEAIQRLLLLGVGAAGVVIVVILAVALIIDQVIRPAQTVATVGSETISVAQFSARTRLERALLSEQINEGISLYAGFGLSRDQIVQQISNQQPYSGWLNELSVPDQLGNRVLNEMVDDALIRQVAAERGITVTDEEIQAEINEFFGYDPNIGLVEPTPTPTLTPTRTPVVSPTPSPAPTATPLPTATPTSEATEEAASALPTATSLPTVTPVPSPTPTATPNPDERRQQFETRRSSFFSRVTSSAGVSEEALRDYFRMRVLRQKVRDSVLEASGDVTTGMFVNARHILVATREEADRVIAALSAGESFAALAQTLSTDTGSGALGGELGWAQPSRYVTEFANAVRDGAIGEIVGPVQTQFGFHIIQVLGREDRPIEAAEAEQERDSRFVEWFSAYRAEQNASITISDIWVDNVPTEPVFVARGL
jgi:parvulin-like peptidyl-prolyl isomerase